MPGNALGPNDDSKVLGGWNYYDKGCGTADSTSGQKLRNPQKYIFDANIGD
jgi:hypothetical protein